MEEVYSIRLVVQKQDSAYQARWIDGDGQESQLFELTLPVGEADAEDLRWYLEKFHGFVGPGTRVRARAIERRIEDWGRELFAAIFEGTEGTNVYRNLLDAAKAKRPVLLTLGSADSRFLMQPWELMRDGRGPLAFQGISIRRQLVGAKPAAALSLDLPLRLLLIVARPNGAGFIDPRSSMGPLLDALDLLPAGSVQLEFCQPPTLLRLEELISAARKAHQPFHIVHFDGHGTYLKETGVGALCFEKDDLSVDLVLGRRLGDLLARLEIPLVMLEACRTSDLSDQPVFGSLAPALLESGVGSVVAFSHSVHIEASRILVERFYKELASGLTVGQALSEARAALRARPQRWLHLGPQAASVDMQDWFIPQLYQVGKDPSLPAGTGKAAGPAAVESRPEERMFGFPPKPIYRFHGRARDLLAMERAFERHPALLLTGGGGMGKTALAREAAWWWLRTGRFEVAVFVSFEQPITVERVVQELGRACEGAAFSSHSGEEQERLALALFRQKKVLLVWDNFESTLPQFQPSAAQGPAAYAAEERARLRGFFAQLTESKGQGRLLVTCRPTDAGLPGIKERTLEGLDRYDSLHLLHAIADMKDIELERKGYEREEVEKLLDLLGDHPLSLSLVGPHLKKLTPAEIRKDFARHFDTFKDETAEEGRNRSLRASLAFSTSRLSAEAQAVLPFLAWFQGGVFEGYLLAFAKVEAAAWARIRSELESTALLRVETLEALKMPFLRFHPTLPFAASRDGVGDMAAAEQRFIAVYLAVMQEVDKALRGNLAAAGMALLEREEANFRLALDLAFRRGERQLGEQLAGTLSLYLQMAARLRERDALVDWVFKHLKDEGLDTAVCNAVRQHSLSLAGRGRPEEAVSLLQQLIARLEAAGGELGKDFAFEHGATYVFLGQVFVQARRPDLALGPSQKAIEILERLPGEAAESNLTVALGDIANAYRALGRLNEALVAAERGLAINREAGRERSVSAGLGQCASILREQQRWAEAEASYAEAQALSRRFGDLDLQGVFLQHRGAMRQHLGNPGRAIELFEQALALFQQSGNSRGEMQTCDLIASAEMAGGQLDVAESWFEHTRELALSLGAQSQVAVTAQNLGILYQKRAEQLEDGEARQGWLHRALASVKESLMIGQERNDQVGAAGSYHQLGIIHRVLGDLDAAEENSRKALRIFEDLDNPNLFKVYHVLAEIVAARGNAQEASELAAKRDAKMAALKQWRSGGGTPENPQA